MHCKIYYGRLMSVDRVLAALEEYFSLKRDLGEIETPVEPNVLAARDRAGMALNEYIQTRFNTLLIEDHHKIESPTIKVQIPDAGALKFSWEDIAGLMDALNSPPNPPSEKQIHNTEAITRWVRIYRLWYSQKRTEALRSLSPIQTLDLELEE